jgi:ABC-type transport system involved in multi-copper enzyme maturation permease subunit
MLSELIRKEILNNLLNLRFSLAYFLCTLLLIGGASTMLADYLTEKKIYETNLSFYGHELDGVTSASEYLHSEKTVLRRPSVTRIFAIGGERDPDMRASAQVNQPPYFYGDFKRNYLVNLFPVMDMLFIVSVILSLLIFVLTYDALSGEREEGTLKVLLSCPVPRDLVYFAKWVGGVITLLMPLITAWLAVMFLLVISPSAGISSDDWMRMAAILVAASLYVAVLFSLSLMISVIARDSSTSIVICLLVWAIGVLVIPSTSAPLSWLINRTMTTMGVWEMETGNKYWPRQMAAEQKISQAYSEAVEKSMKEHRDNERFEFSDEAMNKVNGVIAQEAQLIDDDIIADYQKRTSAEVRIDKTAQWISRISPYGCLQNAAITFAGTGMHYECDLRTALQTYLRNSLLTLKNTLVDGEEFSAANLPAFTIPRFSIKNAARDSMPDFAVLAVMGVLFFMIGYLKFMRMEAL